MEELRARRVVDGLRGQGVPASLRKAGVYQFGVVVALSDGREAVWDTDGTAGLEATVMADGMLRGFVPTIEGSEHFTEEQVVEAIWHTDYDAPVGRRRDPRLEVRPGDIVGRHADVVLAPPVGGELGEELLPGRHEVGRLEHVQAALLADREGRPRRGGLAGRGQDRRDRGGGEPEGRAALQDRAAGEAQLRRLVEQAGDAGIVHPIKPPLR